MKPSHMAVAERELLRLGRRWQTMAARTAFGFLLFLLVAGVYAAQMASKDTFDVTSLQEVGRALFMVWAWTQFLVVLAMTPLLVGQAIIDEKDEQTLELLAITRLNPTQILWGKLVSRLIGVEAIMLAGLPVLALVLGFGGVSPLEMFGAFAQANVAMLVCGAVATFCGLYARSPVIVALQTWGWLFVGWIVVGTVTAGIFAGASMGWLSINPLAAMVALVAGQQMGFLRLVAPMLVWTVVAFAVMKVAAVCFTTLALGNADPDSADADLSAGFWSLDKLVKRMWPLGGLCFLLTPLVFARGLLAMIIPVLPDIFAYAWLAATYSVGGVGYLLLLRRQTLKQNRKKKEKAGGRQVGWKELADHYDHLPADESGAWQAVQGAGEQREHHVAAALAGTRRRRSRLSPFNRRVWDDPVAWRESVTNAHGQLRRSLAAFYILTAVVFVLLLLTGVFGDDEVALAFGGAMLTFAPPLVLLLATSSIVGERRAGSLELLCATPLGAGKILRGKLLAVGYYMGPALALGALLVLAGSTELVIREGPLLLLGGLAWYFAVLLAAAIGAMWRALAVKQPAQAWVVNIITPVLLLWLVSAVSMFVDQEAEALAWAWGVVVPFALDAVSDRHIGIYTLVSTGFWLLVSAVVFQRAALLMRRHAAAM